MLARAGSLSAASLELGITTSAVSKHLANMEARAKAQWVNRTTRQMRLTAEGKLYLEHARRVAAEIEGLEQALGLATETAKGLLRVNATPGFGRSLATQINTTGRTNPSQNIFGHKTVLRQLAVARECSAAWLTRLNATASYPGGAATLWSSCTPARWRAASRPSWPTAGGRWPASA